MVLKQLALTPSVQLFSPVQFLVTPRTAVRQPPCPSPTPWKKN